MKWGFFFLSLTVWQLLRHEDKIFFALGLPKVHDKSNLRWSHRHMTKGTRWYESWNKFQVEVYISLRCTLQPEIKMQWIPKVSSFLPFFGWAVYSGFYTWETCKVFDSCQTNVRIFSILSGHIWLINNRESAGTHIRSTQYVQHSSIFSITLTTVFLSLFIQNPSLYLNGVSY